MREVITGFDDTREATEAVSLCVTEGKLVLPGGLRYLGRQNGIFVRHRREVGVAGWLEKSRTAEWYLCASQKGSWCCRVA
ncbi:hypothetical protein QQ045_008851 [Rhodiola kirilowii]